MSVREIQLNKEEVKLQMASMIDIVFLLLSFFIITYRTPELEGDFNIRMPAVVQSNKLPMLDELTPLTVTLSCDANGELNGIRFGNSSMGVDFNQLREAIYHYIQSGSHVTYQEAMLGSATPSFRNDLEVELDCDPRLRYRYTMQAITAITGYLNGENQMIKMVEKIKFTPPKQ